MEFRRHYGYDVKKASDEAAEAAYPIIGESMTVQSMLEDSDINVMLRRFGVIGVASMPDRMPEYGDFTGVSDYQSALHAVMDAEDRFLKLDANIRARFDNDPQMLLEFVSDPSNRAEGVKLGLFKEIGHGDVGQGSAGSASEAAGVDAGASAPAG